MTKGRTVPGNADSKTMVVFAAFVAKDEHGKLTLFYSGDIVQQAFTWNAEDVGTAQFKMTAGIEIRGPRFIYVQHQQHVPMIGWPDGIYLPSGRFVELRQHAEREISVGGVRIDAPDRKL